MPWSDWAKLGKSRGPGALGELLAENGRMDHARLAWQRVLSFDPGHETALRGLAALQSRPPVQTG